MTTRSDTLPRGQLRETVTYLEMRAPVARTAPRRLPDGLILERVPRPGLAFYRHLQRTIGEPWLWRDRLRLDDAGLAAILHDPRNELRVARAGNAVAGMLELDWRQPGEVEIGFLGVVPQWIGRGLGGALMDEALRRAWGDPSTRRVWLHTCTHDHPGALDFYRNQGFEAYRREEETFDDPRLTGLLPRDAAPRIPLARE